MSLIEAVRIQRLSARKAKMEVETNILTTLVGELETQAKKTGTDITDEQVIAAVKKLIKSNNESLKVRPQEKLIQENAVLELLLPRQLTEDEIRRLIEFHNLQGVPAVMQFLNANYTGMFDKALASSIARS